MEESLEIDQDSILKELYVNNAGDIFNQTLGSKQSNECHISDETYMFLKQKLTDANSTIASYSQRETNLKDEIDRIKRDNNDKLSNISNLKNELQSYRSKTLTTEQKLDNETRARFSFQDKVDELEREITEKSVRNKFLEEKTKDTSLALNQSEALTKHVYNVATDACSQNSSLKEQIQILEEMLKVLKTKLTDFQTENKHLKSDFGFIKDKYDELEIENCETVNEINLLKEEAAKQDSYINDTLNRFQEIGIHFMNMKKHFLKQHKSLENYHEEILQKSNDESSQIVILNDKIKVLDEDKQKATLREMETKNKMNKLEESLNAIHIVRHEMEERNKLTEMRLDEMGDFSGQLKIQNENLKTLLSVSKDQLAEKVERYNELKKELEEWQTKTEELVKKKEDNNEEITTLRCNSKTILNEKENICHENETLKETLRKVETDLSILRNENYSLCQHVKNKENEMKILLNESNNIEQCLQQRHSEFVKLNETCQRAVREKEKVEISKNELSRRNDDLMHSRKEDEKQIKELEDKLNQHQVLLVENDARSMELNQDNTKLICENNELKKSHQNLIEQIQQLKLTNREIDHNLTDMKSNNAELKLNYDNLINEKEAMREKLSENLKRITMVMQGDESKLRGEVTLKIEENEKLRVELKSYEEMLTHNKLQLLQSNERIHILSNKNETLSEQIEKLNQEKEKKNQELVNKEKIQVELQTRIETFNDDLNNLRNQYREKKQDYERLNEKYSSWELQWENVRTEMIQDLNEELSKDVHHATAMNNSLWDV